VANGTPSLCKVFLPHFSFLLLIVLVIGISFWVLIDAIFSVGSYLFSRPRIGNSETKLFDWSCLKLRCQNCFLNIPSLLTCPKTDLAFSEALISWEVWGKQDISAISITPPTNPALVDATFEGCLGTFMIEQHIIVPVSS
jgi:hypothetical protein